jgi:hypothetical protein
MAGRPTKYKEEYNDQVIKLCRLGATDKEIADFFDVKEQTVNNWKKSEPSFFESLKKGKVISDTNISESLYKKALGYYYTEEKEVRIKDYNEEGKQIERVAVVELKKYVPADTTAQIFWLKNRRRDQWRDKQEHEISGKDGEPIQVTWQK